MFLTLDRLCERAGELGNHMRRFIRVVQLERGEVVTRLEETGTQGRISFGDPARDLRGEMTLIASVVEGAREKTRFLSFYYALQYIVMEIHCLDLLKYHLIEAEGQSKVAYERCIAYAQRRFRELSSAYLEMLCDIVLPVELRGRYVVLGVGTMGDRDDIDVAVVDTLDEAQRRDLSRGLSRLAQVMQRTSCALDFHMAEEMGSQVLSAPFDQYVELAGRKPYHPVVISQMILASPLAGSDELGSRFVRQVGGRFLFWHGETNIDHEGLLRSMLGELTEMIRRPVSPRFISPKEDGLRLIKAYLILCKSVHHVPATDWVGIMDFVQVRGSSYREQLEVVAESLTFLETVRYLYQLLVVEEESIHTEEKEHVDGLRAVARTMGFRRRASLDEHVPFLMAYYEVVDRLKVALDDLVVPLVDHLRHITALSFFFDPGEPGQAGGIRNLPVRHVREARQFFGTRFWDDLLGEFARADSPAGRRYVSDLLQLSQPRRVVILKGLVEWGVLDMGTFLWFMIVIRSRAQDVDALPLFTEMVDLFLERCRQVPAVAERLAAVFSLWPAKVNRFLSVLDRSELGRFQELAAGRVELNELVAAGETLALLVEAYRVGSDRFVGPLRSATERHPECLLQLKSPSDLRSMADMLYGQAERFSDLFSRREWLVEFHQLDEARLGLEFLSGRPYRELVDEFRTNTHILLRSLYFLCRKELYDLYRLEWSQRHSIAVFVDAGCTGYQLFDRSLRMFAVLFQDDPELERFFREVVSSYQEELASLGFALTPFPAGGNGALIPYRLHEQLAKLERAAADTDDPLLRLQPFAFSRIIGTRGHLSRYADEVVGPLVAPLRGELAALMRQRFENLSGVSRDGVIDPLEMPGGLRDIELFALHRESRLDPSQRSTGTPACGTATDGDGDVERELGRNRTLLQVLAAAHRLLHWQGRGTSVDAAFVRSYSEILARRPEVPENLIAEPEACLRQVACRNVELMGRVLEGEEG